MVNYSCGGGGGFHFVYCRLKYSMISIRIIAQPIYVLEYNPSPGVGVGRCYLVELCGRGRANEATDSAES